MNGGRQTDTRRLMNDATYTNEFVKHVTDVQRDLYAYIHTLLPRAGDADDVLQEANAVLWRKRDEFEPGTDFRAWAYRVAQYEALAFRKRMGRERHCFDERLIEQMADELAVRREAYDDRRKALTDCTNRLSAKDRELLALRYTESMRAPEIASRLGRTSVAIRQALFRVRAALKRCIDSKMTAT